MDKYSFYLEQSPDTKLENYVGTEGYDAFRKLAQYLGKNEPPFLARLAPSVVVRSDLQLLNIDSPRFAVRIYLDADRSSFVNLRRMLDVRRRLSNTSWRVPAHSFFVREDIYHPLYDGPSTPLHAFEKKLRFGEDAIADCVLIPPSSRCQYFDFVTAELGWVYGEGKSIRGIPFVRPLSGFGGGACAQACAFMVATLLHSYPAPEASDILGTPGIHGLAEITAITSEPANAYLRLRGLKQAIIIEYFVRTGRNAAVYQFDGPDVDEEVKRAIDVVGVYVRSGLSSIVPVAAEEKGRMPKTHNHAVVVVGASKHPENHQIVVNNPAEFPFRVWDFDKFKRRTVLGASLPPACNPTQIADPQGDTVQGSSALRCPEPPPKRPIVITIMPEAVRLPLVDGVLAFDRTTMPAFGVVSMAKSLMETKSSVLANVDCRAPEIGDFVLFRFELKRPGQQSCDPHLNLPEHLKRLLNLNGDESFRTCWDQLARYAGRWCWLQACRNNHEGLAAVLLWDAEVIPIHLKFAFIMVRRGRMFYRPENFVLACFYQGEKGWETNILRQAPVPKMAEEQYEADVSSVSQPDLTLHPIDKEPLLKIALSSNVTFGTPSVAGSIATVPELLKPSLITSFATSGLTKAAETWPKDFIHTAELYAFMHRDDGLLTGVGKRPPLGASPTIVEILDGIYKMLESDRKNAIKLLADRVCNFASTAGVKIEAMATFLPQMFGNNPDSAEAARNALRVLIELRSRLCEKEHDIRTIEIVAGSLIGGLFPARKEGDAPASEPYLFAFRRSSEEAYRELLDGLTNLCEEIDGQKIPSDDFSISLELEPGPLFVLNRMNALLELANAINESDILRRRVGFNVDIAHFVLAGVYPERVFASELLADRICHFHISDHGFGHFGDAPIGECSFGKWSRPSDPKNHIFKRWIDFAMSYAAKRHSQSEGLPRFSGLISVELEAAESPALVKRSCKTLVDLLKETRVSPSSPIADKASQPIPAHPSSA